MTTPALMSTPSPLPREMQCAYRSKFCDAPRATKLDGTLHKLCDFHRRKANANQQRLHKRKKRILAQQQLGQDAPLTPRADKRARLSPESPQSATEPIDGLTFQSRFDLLEVKILEVLLFDSEASTRQHAPMMALLKDESPLMAPVFDDAWSVTL
ncbi:hypothetical protein PRIC1_003304 [Phytophthora ramorum]|uniref:Uncharacterized protein n=1 Tax=Phytophthora ramorum TaxID=164328 RepID=H3GI35_PHYRM|nr:hypothetical protein KRP23_10158 [Phytophthora ramorum]KAH7503859.1 hypothetical protein KRP22_6906 [Phytophthora ramorum]